MRPRTGVMTFLRPRFSFPCRKRSLVTVAYCRSNTALSGIRIFYAPCRVCCWSIEGIRRRRLGCRMDVARRGFAAVIVTKANGRWGLCMDAVLTSLPTASFTRGTFRTDLLRVAGYAFVVALCRRQCAADVDVHMGRCRLQGRSFRGVSTRQRKMDAGIERRRIRWRLEEWCETRQRHSKDHSTWQNEHLRRHCRAEAPRLKRNAAEDLQCSKQGVQRFKLRIIYSHDDATRRGR